MLPVIENQVHNEFIRSFMFDIKRFFFSKVVGMRHG